MTTDFRAYLRSLPVFAGELPRFDPDAAPDKPDDLFREWLVEAVEAGVREPHAMTLSTTASDGAPAARVLIVKNVDEHGWQFAAHDTSPKGRDLTAHRAAALTFYWPARARQVRVRGPVVPEPPERSAADFLARPPGSRAEASIGRQSQVLHDPADLDRAIKLARDRLDDQPSLVVPEWTLHTLRPAEVEFWQGDAGRRHTRLRYTRPNSTWQRDILWP
ncbi:pyridoxal 5'-phosphate synthase [Actinoplanes sp. NPDC049265]|uniref:pyridoxine/pyridoxamine 5'-phosphate oxidase n=1 Tax=Actinoplanes sp. NPDC049265 TaxID=3363902 RepID=UPI0037186D7A